MLRIQNVSPLEREIIALPVRFGGLGIQHPSRTAQYEYDASVKVTEQLTELIYQQDKTLSSLENTKIKQVKAEIKNDIEKRFREQLKEVIEKSDPLIKQCFEATQEKGASSWLTALPQKQLGIILNKQ